MSNLVLEEGNHSFSIEEGISAVKDSDFILPALQRGFVWKDTDIVKLFDSIYKKYPFGSLLILKINGEKDKNITTFYKFNQDANSKALFGTGEDYEILDSDIKYCILDGQQRLTALYRGMNRDLKDKKGVDISLYFNVLSDKNSRECFKYGKKQHFYEKESLYIRVGNILKNLKYSNEEKDLWTFIKGQVENIPDDSFYKKTNNNNDRQFNKRSEIVKSYICLNDDLEKNKNLIIDNLKNFLKIFKNTENKIINYQMISFDDIEEKEEKIDRMLNIFTRLNNGGQVLKPVDLLYSQIATYSNSDETKVRCLFDDYINELNDSKDANINFKLDNYLRLLWLIFGESGNFKTFYASKAIKEHCQKEKFDKVKNCLIKAKYIFENNNFKFTGKTAYNMFLPVAYYLYYSDKKLNSEQEKEEEHEIVKYYELSILSGYFSNHSDAILTRFRNAFKNEAKENNVSLFNDGVFNLKILQKAINKLKTLTEKPFAVLESTIEDMLKWNYDDNREEILKLFYVMNRDFIKIKRGVDDLDHMHPKKFSNEKFETEFSNVDKYNFFKQKHNLVANIQLLAPLENREEKNGCKYWDWLKKWHKDDIRDYCYINYIFDDESSNIFADEQNICEYFSLDNFEDFYKERENVIKRKLLDLFGEKVKDNNLWKFWLIKI